MNQNAAQVRVALVEDDPLLRKELHFHLKQQGFIAFAVQNGKSLDELLMTEPLDVLVLDLSLPGEDGISIANRIRKSIPAMGIVMLTARTALPDRVRGYEAGADVYLSKPVAPEELTMTLLSLARRVKKTSEAVAWTLDLQARSIYGSEPWQKAFLTNSEQTLLLALAQAPSHTLETDMICELLSQRSSTPDMGKRALESLVSRLRKKLESISGIDAEPALKAVWGIGYQLCVPVLVKT
jgi:DNA-binding response OmpR family regulator